MPGTFRSTFPSGHIRVDGPGEIVLRGQGQRVKVGWAWSEGGNTQRLTSWDGGIVYYDSGETGFIPGFEAQDGLRVEIVTSGAMSVFFFKS